MFEKYAEIYDKRGHMYHQAMRKWPDARHREFESLMNVARIEQASPVVLDVPSGGGYLASYLPKGAKLISVDGASKFLESGKHDEAHQVICAEHDNIPMDDESADAILSLAGLHHIPDTVSVFEEWHRLLKKGGVLTIGDAQSGSPTTQFLDGVVNQFNSMGHRGDYLDTSQVRLLEQTGFQVEYSQQVSYPWEFKNCGQMLEFCRTLFCMDLEPSDDELLHAIQQSVGYSETEHECHLHWALFFIRAVK